MKLPADALLYARMSQLAYQPSGVINDTAHAMGFTDPGFTFFDQGNTQAFLCADDERVILAFRGTQPDELRDWITDGDARLVELHAPIDTAATEAKPIPPPRQEQVHDGFQTALNAIWGDICVAMIRHAAKRIFLTGHSLGAALATLAACRLAEMGHVPAGLFTFGSPRVGNPAFCAHFDGLGIPTYRMVNDTDCVPRVPTRLMGYGHVGQLYYFGPDGKLAPDDSAWQQLLLDLRGTADDFLSGRLGALSCHFIANYIKACEANT